MTESLRPSDDSLYPTGQVMEGNAVLPEGTTGDAVDEILRAAGTRPEWDGMACVLTVAVIEDSQLTIGHVGDSRLYKLRDGSIDKLTHDHSPVGEREDNQEIPELEAMRHPRRSEVFRDVDPRVARRPCDHDLDRVMAVGGEPVRPHDLGS